MSLVEYRRKRRFDQTKEPEPGKALPQGQRAIFVVQLHHASRRHYDFRLQIGDALKSWAVPKGPSYDPKVKRMAVEVEDHPVDYASFEGEIPKGQYGGGHVAQFDHGVWATQGDPEAQLAKGHLRFELFGTKLKGGWHLVRSGKPARQPQWLLFKDDDAYASDLEADDMLADVSAAPTADIKRAGGGKADKKKLKALPAKRARRKNWAKKALALPKAKEAAPPSGPFEPQLAKLGEPRRRATNGSMRSSGTGIGFSQRSPMGPSGSGPATRWSGPTRSPRYATPWRRWALPLLPWMANSSPDRAPRRTSTCSKRRCPGSGKVR